MEIVKKRYVRCPQCGTYTRFEARMASPLWFLVGGPLLGGLLWWLRTPRAKRPPCLKCGNDKNNFTRAYLATEVARGGKDVAFFTPEGGRVEL